MIVLFPPLRDHLLRVPSGYDCRTLADALVWFEVGEEILNRLASIGERRMTARNEGMQKHIVIEQISIADQLSWTARSTISISKGSQV